MYDTAAAMENWVDVSYDDVDEEWETESMTDVEEPTANTGPTIDAECQVHLAGRDILLVCAPRIEEGWEEIQKVRKPTAVGVGECGVASRKKASIDEGPNSRGNQGVVRDAESNTPPDAVRLARKGKQKKERALPAQQQPSRPRKQQQQLPKACPSCRNRATERLDELDHMLCWGCGCEWCLRCEVAPWREGHECHLRRGGMPREDAERRRGDMLRGGGW